MEKPAAVKVQYGDDIRRFSLNTRSFESLRSVILEAYPELKDSRDWKLKYKDEEGDFITITCDFELAEALNQSLLRIYVVNETPSKPTVAKDFVEKEPSPPAPFEFNERAQESATPSTSAAPAPQSVPLAFDLASLLPLFQGLQSPPSSGETSQPAPLDPKPFLQLLTELQQNQHMFNVLPQIMSTLPQLLSDPALMNLLSTTMQSCPTMVPQLLSVAQQNPAILQALPQLINTVARNPALLNMLPIFLATFAPQGQQPPQQPQQQSSFVQPQPCFYAPQPQPPQSQTPQPQPQPPQQAQQPTYQSSYQPQQWTCSPPSWQQPEFQPQPQAFPFRFFQPTPQVDPSPPTFSFMPDHGESCPSFTFGQGLSSSSLSSSFSSSSSCSSSSSAMPEFFPWQTELQQLESMGFTNVEANKVILRKNNGDMVATVQDLTGAGL